MNLFGSKKKPAAPAATTNAPTNSGGSSTAAAIAKLKDTSEIMDKRMEHLNRKMDNEVKQAQAFSKANKKKEALMCIKRKKMYEKQLEQLSNSKLTLETQLASLENMNITKETVEANRIAATALQRETQQLGGVDAVEETMDQVEEGLQDAEDLATALGRSVAIPGLDADDDELQAELEALEQEQLDSSLGSVNIAADDDEADLAALMPAAPGPSMPAAPKGAVKAMTDEERELAELEASMAMG